MATLKPLLSPKNQFIWNEELELVIRKSKEIIADAIKVVVEIFDTNRLTYL